MSEENPPAVPAEVTAAPVENIPNGIPIFTTIVKHKTCGKLTDLGKDLANSHRLNPKLFANLPCYHCPLPAQRPVSEFTWGDDTPFAA